MVYGEQVAAATDWLSLVRRDLEALGYAVGGIPMEAASAHADHFRDRYWFVADRDVSRWQGRIGVHEQERAVERSVGSSGAALRLGALVNDQSLGWGEGWTEDELRRGGFAAPVASLDGLQFVQCPDGKWRRLPPPGVRWLGNAIPSRVAKLRAFGNAIVPEAAAEFILATRP
jgi:DNA (cytosine-5)-methyltransferase 1